MSFGRGQLLTGHRTLVGVAWLAIVIPGGAWARAQELGIAKVIPEQRTVTAPADLPITVIFDQPVDVNTITHETFWAFGRWSGKVVGHFEFFGGNTVVTLVPDYPYSAGESVMVVLSHDIASESGDHLRRAGYSYQFWVAAASADMNFVKIQELTTRSDPNIHTRAYGGIATDLDGDRFCDITVVNEDTADLRVFLNKADGTGEFNEFLPETFAVNNRASPSEPTDFNHDGFPDICVANINANTISVLLGHGDGTYAPQDEYPVGDAPRGIAVLDVNGDGHIDIVNTNSTGAGSLSMHLNDGTGHFGSAINFEGGGAGEWALAAADMNEDGILDLVCSATGSGTYLVLTCHGDGTFTTTSTQAAGGHIWMLVLGDLNGDRHDDVAGVNSFNNKGVICLGDGQGALGTRAEYAADTFPLATDIGDLDGDGDLDWLNSSYQGDWWLYTNDGDGTFTYLRSFVSAQAASCGLLFDADNDGDVDVGLIDELADTVQIHRNDANEPALSLEVTGTCPGSIHVGVQGAEPRTQVAFILAGGTGSIRVPNGNPCAGTVLGLNGSAHQVGLLRADGSGAISVNTNVPGGACRDYLQALGVSGCAVSNVVRLP